MGRKSKIDKLSYQEKYDKLPPDQQKHIDLVIPGKDDPVYFAEKVLGVRLHPKQKVWLWATTNTQLDKAELLYDKYFEKEIEKGDLKPFRFFLDKGFKFKKNILIPSNRWGKTVVTAVKHIWYNYYKVGVRGLPAEKAAVKCGTLNLSPHSNQAQAGYEYVLAILSGQFVYTVGGKSFKNDCKIQDFYKSSNSQKRQIFFKNGTNYRAVPTGEDQASSLAGTAYLYISYDECAQSLHLKKELPAKIMSRLIDFGGALDLISTPEVDKPSHQYFFHIGKKGKVGEDGWFTMTGKMDDNIFLGEEEMDLVLESIRTTDPAKYRQVKFGEFVTTGAKMFDSLIIERLWDKETPSPVMHDHKYMVSADWGFADTGDPTVFYVVDYTQPEGHEEGNPLDYRIVYREAIQGGSPFAVLTRAKMLSREWNGAKFVHDSAAMGGTMVKKMLKEIEMHDIIDFNASGGNKVDMLFSLLVVLTANRKTAVDEENKVTDLNPNFGRLRSYHIPELEEQLGNYQYNPDKGITDKKLEQDDVMALGMNIWYLEKKINKTKVTQINFNPLAPNVNNIFSEKEAKKIKLKNVSLPEKRIM